MTAQDQSLEALFATARQTSPQPDDAFMSRLILAAEAVQPKPQVSTQAPCQQALLRPASGFWSRLSRAIGGAAVILGMGSAAMAGLVIGYVQPEEMLQLGETIGLNATQQIDILPDFEIFLTEEAGQ